MDRPGGATVPTRGDEALEDDDAGLIERTVALLGDPKRQNRQRYAARQLLVDHCGPGPTLDDIEAIYGHTLAAT
jgi:hypothetical protein